MPKLFLLRHFKSQWNEENRFTGWVDVPLKKNITKIIKESSNKIFKFKIDKIYSSPLFRNEDSVAKIFEHLGKKYPIFIHLDKGKMEDWGHFKEMNKNYTPVYLSQALNERYYGKLQGENKKEMMKEFGTDRVQIWRRSFKTAPPGGESLEEVFKRTVPFYRKYIERDLKKRKNVLIVASHNSLRAIIKYIERISDEDIPKLEIPFGGLIKYEFDSRLKIKKKGMAKKQKQ